MRQSAPRRLGSLNREGANKSGPQASLMPKYTSLEGTSLKSELASVPSRKAVSLLFGQSVGNRWVGPRT